MHDLRLTVGIPTLLARPERLDEAIGSALAQTVPVRVLVSDQRGGEPGDDLRRRYAAHPLVRIVESPATCLWENWVHAVSQCDTEVFAWLQDDDVVFPHFAHRVLACLDACPKASCYVGRLGISFGAGLGNWWQATGPYVPMDMKHGSPGVMNPGVLAAGGYFASHALSPAVAFRWSTEAVACARRVPADAELFAERSILAELARIGPAICDPAVVGYWVHHETNASRGMRPDAERQFQLMLAHLDSVMPDVPNWRDAMRGWFYIVGVDVARRFVESEYRWHGSSPVMGELLDTIEDVHPVVKAERLAREAKAVLVAAPARAARPEVATNGRARRAEKAVARR